MKQTLVVAVQIVVLAAVCMAQQPEPRLITVTGNAELKVEPDKVTVQIGIVSHGATPAEAMEKNKTAEDRLVAAATRFGLGKDDIDPSYTTLTYAEKTKERPQPYYEADEGISLTLHDLSKYGSFLSALLSAGANRVDMVTFGISNLPELRKKVRAMAVHVAREKAEQLAQESGTRITRVHSIGEWSGDVGGVALNGQRNAVMLDGAEAFTAGQQAVTGRISVSLGVSASYEIE